jgi:hypothetical protein
MRVVYGKPSWATSPDWMMSVFADSEAVVVGHNPHDVAYISESILEHVVDLHARLRSLEALVLASAGRRLLHVVALDVAHLRLRVSVPVQLVVDGATVTVSSDDLEVFGAGDDEFSALTNFREALVEEYEFLKTNVQDLGPLPAAQLRRMEQVIEPVPAA